MTVEVEVRVKQPGAAGERLPDVLVQLADEVTTLRELITAAVAEQVRLAGIDAAGCRRALDRQYLTDAEIRAQAATGAVRLPDRAASIPDAAAEADRAVHAFACGVFTVFAAGRQLTGLDEPLVLRLGEPVLFLRLTALVGG